MPLDIQEPLPPVGKLCDVCRRLVDGLNGPEPYENGSRIKRDKWMSSVQDGCVICVSLFQETQNPWRDLKEHIQQILAEQEELVLEMFGPRASNALKSVDLYLGTKNFTTLAVSAARKTEQGMIALGRIKWKFG